MELSGISDEMGMGRRGLGKGMRFVYYWRLSKGEIFYPRLGGSFLNNLILRYYRSRMEREMIFLNEIVG